MLRRYDAGGRWWTHVGVTQDPCGCVAQFRHSATKSRSGSWGDYRVTDKNFYRILWIALFAMLVQWTFAPTRQATMRRIADKHERYREEYDAKYGWPVELVDAPASAASLSGSDDSSGYVGESEVSVQVPPRKLH